LQEALNAGKPKLAKMGAGRQGESLFAAAARWLPQQQQQEQEKQRRRQQQSHRSPEAIKAAYLEVLGDADGSPDGLPVESLAELLGKLGIALTKEQLQQSKAQLDARGSGAVALRELITWMQG
jgi:Ca2+-binding EF-hand superfamily protein